MYKNNADVSAEAEEKAIMAKEIVDLHGNIFKVIKGWEFEPDDKKLCICDRA